MEDWNGIPEATASVIIFECPLSLSIKIFHQFKYSVELERKLQDLCQDASSMWRPLRLGDAQTSFFSSAEIHASLSQFDILPHRCSIGIFISAKGS